MELACFTFLDHLSCVLEGCRLVEAMPEGLPNHRVGCRMAPTLALMDILEDVEAFLSRNTLEQDAI